MCTGGGGSIPKQRLAEPAKSPDKTSSDARDEQQKRMLLARGLESTWTRSAYLGAGNSAAGAGKVSNLGGTK